MLGCKLLSKLLMAIKTKVFMLLFCIAIVLHYLCKR